MPNWTRYIQNPHLCWSNHGNQITKNPLWIPMKNMKTHGTNHNSYPPFFRWRSQLPSRSNLRPSFSTSGLCSSMMVAGSCTIKRGQDLVFWRLWNLDLNKFKMCQRCFVRYLVNVFVGFWDGTFNLDLFRWDMIHPLGSCGGSWSRMDYRRSSRMFCEIGTG